ncbi:MAG: ATP-binding protein [Hyphomicrobiaceae bacterium]|nr:ATP-binding protein [Hyphomicrobiaceae bacterium]
MSRSQSANGPANAHGDIALLLAASLACALMLAAGLTTSATELAGASAVGYAVIVALSLGVLGFSALALVRVVMRTRQDLATARADAEALRERLAVTEAVIGGEPQVLVLWDQGLQPLVVNHTLRGIRGLPHENAHLLTFSSWLDPTATDKLHECLDQLLRLGRPFNMILKTAAGGHLEADGRASSGRAVLRLRDIAGYKREISRIIDGHEALARDINASRALLNALPNPVWLKDRNGRLTWANTAYIEAVEATSLAEVTDRQLELLEVRQRDSLTKALSAAPSCRRRMKLIVGSERRMHEVVVLRLADASAGVATDVSALELAQGELDRQTAAFDRTLDRVATAIAIFDPMGSLVFFNDAYVRLWNLDAAWLKSRPKSADVLDRLRALGRLPEVVNYPEWRGKVLSTHETGDEADRWWHLPDGRILHLIAEQRPDGGLTHLYVDETERLALESRFNALIRVQSETIDSLKEGVAVFATDGRLKLANKAFATIWRLSPDLLALGPHIDEMISAARPLFEDATTWNALKRATTSISDERVPVGGRMARADGSVVDYAVTPLPDGATLLAFADVTDSKRYERALVERNEALVAADKLKNRFIERISYELRTPLTNIIGFTDLLLSPLFGDLTARQRDYLADISNSSSQLLSIIDGILDLATIDAGALVLTPEPVDVSDLVYSALRAIQDRAEKAGLTFDVALGDDVGSITADKTRMRQVLFNLLSNAVGFSSAGSTVYITCWREAGELIVQIEDRGTGIPREEQERVFDRFESSSRGSKHRGAGLGLAISKSLVDLHGGDIVLDSEPGVGTRVTIRLPEAGPPALQQPDGAVLAPPARQTA